MAQLFDPAQYRVLLFDQRGCGKSRRSGDAAAQIQANNTWLLVEDIEALRRHLGVERWVVAGGSWGSCLALAYASRHACRVLGIVMRAACLFRDEEMDFFLGPGPGARTSCPDAWSRLTGWLRADERGSAHDIATAFRAAALGQDARLSPQEAVSRWLAWEGALMSARPPSDAALEQARRELAAVPAAAAAAPPAAPRPPQKPWPGLGAGMQTQALLTMHYVVERAFLPAGFSLVEAARDFGFPLRIVHGKNDCVCPAKNARDLAAAAPDAELWLTDGGHSQWDPDNITAFVDATDSLMADVLRPA